MLDRLLIRPRRVSRAALPLPLPLPLVLVAAAACGTAEPEPVPTTPATLAAVSAATLAGRVGDSTAVAVRVLTAAGRPLAGQTVVFAPVGTSGTVGPSAVATDAGGEARTTWRFGGAVGSQLLTAQVGTLPPLAIAATISAGRPATLAGRDGNGQEAVAGTAVAVSPSVVVRDGAGNGVPGVRVAFAVERGGGHAVGDTATTDADGVATVGAWLLGARVGENTLAAQVVGEGSLPAGGLRTTFDATGVAGTAARVVAATPVTGSEVVGSTLATEALPTVTVADAHGNTIYGATVTFTTITARGRSTVSVPVDGAGRATLPTLTLSTKVGVDSVVASIPGAAPAAFTFATRADAPSFVSVVGGTEQAGRVGTVLALPIVVLVADRYGNPVPGIEVRFRPTGDMAVADPRQTTDARGRATSGAVTIGRTGIVVAEVAGTRNTDFWPTRLSGPPARALWSDRSVTGVIPLYVEAGRSTGSLGVSAVDADDVLAIRIPITLCVVPATAGTLLVAGASQPSACVTTTTGEITFQFQANPVSWPWYLDASLVVSGPGPLDPPRPVYIYRR